MPFEVRWVTTKTIKQGEKDLLKVLRRAWRMRVARYTKAYRKMLRADAPVRTGVLRRSVRVRMRRWRGRLRGRHLPNYSARAKFAWYGRFVRPRDSFDAGKRWAPTVAKRLLRDIRKGRIR